MITGTTNPTEDYFEGYGHDERDGANVYTIYEYAEWYYFTYEGSPYLDVTDHYLIKNHDAHRMKPDRGTHSFIVLMEANGEGRPVVIRVYWDREHECLNADVILKGDWS